MEKRLNSMCIDVEETKKQAKSQSQHITSLEGELKNVNALNTRLRGNYYSQEIYFRI